MSEIFATLRNLLSGPPRQETSSELNSLLHSCYFNGDVQTLDMVVEYARQHTRAWPSHFFQLSNLTADYFQRDNFFYPLTRELKYEQKYVDLQELKAALKAIPDSMNALESLTFRYHQINTVLEELLAHYPFLDNLHHLHLSNNEMGRLGVEFLLRQDWLPQLKSLHLDGNAFGSRGGRDLMFDAHLSHLEKLSMAANNLGQTGHFLEALQARPCPLHNLKSLNLARNSLKAEFCEVLCKSSLASQLESLDLSRNPIGLEGLQILGQQEAWPTLKSLKLRKVTGKRDKSAWEQAWVEFCGSPWLEGIEELNLEHNPLHQQAFQALMDSPYTDSLRKLYVETSYDFDAAFLKKLANHPLSHAIVSKRFQKVLRPLRDLESLQDGVLDLDKLNLTPEGFRTYFHSKALLSCRVLRLSDNDLSAELLGEMVVEHNLPQLEELYFERNDCPDGTLSLFCAHADKVPSLRILSLEETQLEEDSMLALAHSGLLGQLETLNLDGTYAPDEGMAALFSIPEPSSLRVLSMAHSYVFECINDLLQSRSFPHLEELSFRYGYIESDDVRKLLESGVFPSLQKLDVTGMRLSLEFARWWASEWKRWPAMVDQGNAYWMDFLQGGPKGLELYLSFGGRNPKASYLLEAPDLSRIVAMTLNTDSISPADFATLLQNRGSHLNNLRVLSFWGQSLSEENIRALCYENPFANLDSLSIGQGMIPSSEGYKLFWDSPLLEQITDLSLSITGLTEQELQPLLQRNRPTTIQQLSLCERDISLTFAQELLLPAIPRLFPQLQSFYLDIHDFNAQHKMQWSEQLSITMP